MTAELGTHRVGAHDHRQRVPPHQRAQTRLDLEVARKRRLVRERDRIQIWRVQYLRQRYAPRSRVLQQLFQHKRGALGTNGVDQSVERVQPFARFQRIGIVLAQAPGGVRNQLRQVVEIHAAIIHPATRSGLR